MAGNVQPLIPHVFGVYLVIMFLFNCWITALVLVTALVGALLWFRFPQVSRERADAILLDAGKASVIAHKGGCGDAPENTIAAIRLAAKNGATAMEFDVGYTSDGVPVLLHDDTVDRTTDGSGFLKDLPWSKVQNLSAAVKDANRDSFPDEKVPLLEDGVRACLELGMKIFFDVKGNPAQSAQAIPGLYKKYPKLYSEGIVCSFHPSVIYKVRQADADIVTALTWRPNFISCSDIYGPYRETDLWKQTMMSSADVILRWAHFTWLPALIGNSAFLVHKDVVCGDMVRDFGQRNIQVVVWTVNDVTQKKFLMETLKLPIITDYVKA